MNSVAKLAYFQRVKYCGTGWWEREVADLFQTEADSCWAPHCTFASFDCSGFSGKLTCSGAFYLCLVSLRYPSYSRSLMLMALRSSRL